MDKIDNNKYFFLPYTGDQKDMLLPLVQKDEQIRKFLCGDISQNATIVYYDKSPIGYYSVHGFPDGELQLGIFEDYRGQGHGKFITQKVTQECFDDNYGSMILRIDKDNLASQASAKASGFRRDYDGELAYGDREVPYIIYYKRNYNYEPNKRGGR